MRKEDPIWMDNLTEWILDENKIVTVKYLSRALKCHANSAKERLFHFAEQNKDKDLEVVVLEAGSDPKDGARTVSLMKKSDLSESHLENLTSKHVYAVGKKSLFAKGYQPLALTLLEASKEFRYVNNYSAIVNKRAVPRSDIALKLEKPKEEEQVTVSTKLASKPKATDKKIDDEKPAVSEEEKKPSQAVKIAPSKKPTSIAGMFAKAAAKKKENPVEVISSRKRKEPDEQDEDAKDQTPETSPGKENRDNEAKEREQAKTTKSRRKSKEKSAKLQTQPKRKRIQMMSDSESESEGENEAERDDAERREEEEPPSPQTTARKVESDEDEDIIPATPNQAQDHSKRRGRKRVKKMVEKTFTDEQGFMVTKKMYESCSETDNEEGDAEQKSNKAPSPVKAKPEPIKKGKKGTSAASQAPKQASIMSFFKKK